MGDFSVIWHWIEFAVRWTHVITGIAWIGSSFYFIALDLGLTRDPAPVSGADGEEWQVHGGGFYHIQKYMVAPDAMPEHLTWFKWEAYSTWLSGAALLAIVYWVGAEIFLVDPEKADLAVGWAIVISAASLAVGWVIYDLLCKSRLGHSPTALMVLLFVLLVIMAWGYDQIFTGRAALLHLGAFTATIMSANVFFIIIPNQRIVVADLKEGRAPDPEYGRIAKLRSTHNNYLTLPVLFLMLSNHYPLAFATEWNWLIAGLVFLMGVTIRHWFNSHHARKGSPHWTWAVTVLLFLAIAWLSTEPGKAGNGDGSGTDAVGSTEISPDPEDPLFDEVVAIVQGRCAMCHGADPAWPGIHTAPKGVHLETPAQVFRHREAIYLQAAISRAMPPGNRSWMEQEERNAIREWYRGQGHAGPRDTGS